MHKCPWCAGDYTDDTWNQHCHTIRHRVWMTITRCLYLA